MFRMSQPFSQALLWKRKKTKLYTTYPRFWQNSSLSVKFYVQLVYFFSILVSIFVQCSCCSLLGQLALQEKVLGRLRKFQWFSGMWCSQFQELPSPSSWSMRPRWARVRCSPLESEAPVLASQQLLSRWTPVLTLLVRVHVSVFMFLLLFESNELCLHVARGKSVHAAPEQFGVERMCLRWLTFRLFMLFGLHNVSVGRK